MEQCGLFCRGQLIYLVCTLLQASLTHYTVDRTAFAQLLQHATGVPEAGALLAQPAMSTDGCVPHACPRHNLHTAASVTLK
jgi:hypothetical protein